MITDRIYPGFDSLPYMGAQSRKAPRM